MPNIEKLDELVAWATMEDVKRRAGLPNEWDQRSYVTVGSADDVPAHCGTTCCLAGKTVLDAGALPTININYLADAEFFETLTAVYSDGTEVVIETEAERLLDLGSYQASELFRGGNTLEHVVQIVDQIKSGDAFPYVDRYQEV